MSESLRSYLFPLSILLFLPGFAVAQELGGFVKEGKLDLQAAVAHFDDLYRSDSSVGKAQMIVTKPRRTKTMTMSMWSKGQDRSLIVIDSPAREKGTATLKVEKNLWNYLPRIKRTVRIPPSMMLGSWMGSDFTNDDLVRESSFLDDYDYELVGPSQDPRGWHLRFTAREGTVGLWSRFELILSENGMLPVRATYYDRKDELARSIVWSEVKEFDGKTIPSHMTLIPEDLEGQKTEMIYLEISFDVDLPDSTFNLSRLEQER